MTHHQHGVCVAVIIFGVLCNFALSLENNESRLMQIPRDEFIRVMSDIISGGDKNASSSVEVSTTDDEGFYDPMDPNGENGYLPSYRSESTMPSPKFVDETPRTTATKQAQTRASAPLGSYPNSNGTGMIKRNRRVKSDSLYFLQRSMETRENAQRMGQTYRSDEGDESDHHLPNTNNA